MNTKNILIGLTLLFSINLYSQRGFSTNYYYTNQYSISDVCGNTFVEYWDGYPIYYQYCKTAVWYHEYGYHQVWLWNGYSWYTEWRTGYYYWYRWQTYKRRV